MFIVTIDIPATRALLLECGSVEEFVNAVFEQRNNSQPQQLRHRGRIPFWDGALAKLVRVRDFARKIRNWSESM